MVDVYIVEGERTVKQRVLFLVDACSKFNASQQCRNGEALKEFVLEETTETKPTNFKHLGILTTEDGYTILEKLKEIK